MSFDPSAQDQSAGGGGSTPQPPAPFAPTPTFAPPESAQGPSYIPAGVVPKATPPKAKGGTSLLTIALIGAVVIAAVGIGFAGGRATAPTATGRGNGGGFANGGNGGGFPTGSGRPGGGFGGGFGALGAGSIALSGSVVAIGNGTITVQPANGAAPVTIDVPSTTTYHAQAAATTTDVSVGSQVQVTVNRPQFRGGPDASGAPGGGGANPAASPGARGNGSSLTATDILVTGK
jgi:hypothetical protein